MWTKCCEAEPTDQYATGRKLDVHGGGGMLSAGGITVTDTQASAYKCKHVVYST